MTAASPAGPCVPFASLGTADLIIDTCYAGGSSGHAGDDPISKLIPRVGNQGGFRHCGSPFQGTVKLSVLYTTGGELDWPDQLDLQTGVFTYFGDNRTPGRELHETSRGGNLLLRDAFAAAHGTPAERAEVPPFLLFEKAPEQGRAVYFRGLLVPGGPTMTTDDELAAVWRSTGGRRFQNYRARFTVLDEGKVPRSWITHVVNGGDPLMGDCPPAWHAWVTSGVCTPLLAPSTTLIRKTADQLPAAPQAKAMLEAIRKHFQSHPHGFEACAVALWRLIAPATGRCDVTRPSRDGGRDAIGEYILGPPADRIAIDFALEAKCYAETNGVGVKEVSRLISRLRHRNFGVFVTTSYFAQQVQQEVREDQHPIALVCGRDIAEALLNHGYKTSSDIKVWLDKNFPVS
ncbi:restriction endonuclease [Actinomadura montaniterrae]|uniref:Restriction endonuclease n=1 Tax=Actinomadura montaniterrae TaxID=1803903 RepID=A0A6L3VFZ6_9ACTN|nr:restriction endonuclease [Actinomadura montaniterrae]KAB2365214.1 restriction endonuclease [Actinomadura montaniterrae]